MATTRRRDAGRRAAAHSSHAAHAAHAGHAAHAARATHAVHAARARVLAAAVAAADAEWERMQARGRTRWTIRATLEGFMAFSGMWVATLVAVGALVAWLLDYPLTFRWSWLLGPIGLVLPTQHLDEPAVWIAPATILALAWTSAHARWRAAADGAVLRRPTGLPLDAATKARRLAALGVTLPAAVGP